MADIRHHTIRTNGISMHVAEAGSGFPVVMCHGWPELWYSWRHQLHALGDNGFRAIAPDMRGYGRTDAPRDPAQYTLKILCRDMVGLLDELDIEKAVFVGHDWGGAVLWQMGLRYPERVERLIGLNTPYSPPAPGGRPTIAMRDAFGLTDRTFYMRYFQTPGVAEAEFEADVRGNLAKIFMPYTRAQDLWTFATVGGDGSGALTRVPPGATFLTDAELDVYVTEFTRTGFTGGFNWYRAADLNADEVGAPVGPGLDIKSMMITAENDLILRPEMAAHMPSLIPGIRMENIRNCAHWTQQERAPEVNALMLDFLKDLKR
jgi:soluble epoxide hydrolase/lipid-phosphate phosphatase